MWTNLKCGESQTVFPSSAVEQAIGSVQKGLRDYFSSDQKPPIQLGVFVLKIWKKREREKKEIVEMKNVSNRTLSLSSLVIFLLLALVPRPGSNFPTGINILYWGKRSMGGFLTIGKQGLSEYLFLLYNKEN